MLRHQEWTTSGRKRNDPKRHVAVRPLQRPNAYASSLPRPARHDPAAALARQVDRLGAAPAPSASAVRNASRGAPL